jgi:signal transduction histidine kinase
MYDVVADRERSFDEQVDALLALGRDVLGTTYGTLSSVEDGEYVVEAIRPPDDVVQAGDTPPLSSTICERMVTDEERLVIDDVAAEGSDLAERPGVERLDVQCYLGAPVFVEDEVFGTFCFYGNDRDREFSDWDVTLVDLMARWVSYELEARRRTEHLREKNERLERFVSIVSHDLRNPLAVADGSLELAARTGENEHFERARRALERMERLVDDLLSLARAGEAIEEPTPVALAPLVRRTWDGCATPGASLSLAVEADRVLLADESRLRQLVENLVRNAVEHGGEGATVRVGSLPDGFFVADDGPGVPEAERERVFEHGYSTDDGTGLGLAIVAEVAEAHGWDVRVCEGTAGGARFEVSGVEFVDD